MKNITKILAALLCAVMLFALCACDSDDKDTENGKDTSAVTDTDTDTVKETETGTGDIDIGGIILPEDGKIEFGKDNKDKSEEVTGTSETAVTDKKDGNKSSGGNSGSNIEQSGGTTSVDSSEASAPSGNEDSSTGISGADDKGWGDVQWN